MSWLMICYPDECLSNADLWISLFVVQLTQEVTDVSQINTGANASEEDPGEQADGSSAQSGINVVLANRLVDVQFTKKTYQVYIKDYMKDL